MAAQAVEEAWTNGKGLDTTTPAPYSEPSLPICKERLALCLRFIPVAQLMRQRSAGVSLSRGKFWESYWEAKGLLCCT